ncbi:MAG: ABC transporter permease [Pseudomonadota bacterium]|jgi:putative ABC transport system permease protein
MLIGNRGKFYAMVFGVALTSLIITQQSSIFLGLMSRTVGFIFDTAQPDLWVMDPKVQFVDDIKPLQDTKLLQVRGVRGVEWAVPLYKGSIRARLPNGTFQTCNVIGLDDSTLIAGPPIMIEGELADLRRADGVIVDEAAAKGKLAKPGATPKAPKIPLKVGDILELNDNRAVVVGIARVTRTFQSQPVIYTTYSRAMRFAPRERKLLSFILAKVADGHSMLDVTKRINQQTGLAAFTAQQFKGITIRYFMKNTGIPINFGIAIGLGFLVGVAIVGQTFFSFIIDNMRYLGILKAMGASNRLLFRMILLQTLIVGAIGSGLGMGIASLTSILSKNSELAFYLPWQVPLITVLATTLITLITAVISLRRVLRLEPGIVFRG